MKSCRKTWEKDYWPCSLLTDPPEMDQWNTCAYETN